MKNIVPMAKYKGGSIRSCAGVSLQKKQEAWLWLILFYVPCPFRTWMFRALYNFLSFGVMLIFLLSLSLPYSAIYCVCVTYFHKKKQNNFQLLAMKAVFITAVGKTKEKKILT